MKRVACYVRVSTLEQKNHGLSVDSQIIALQEYCKSNNYIVAGIYNDAGISARKKYKKRPALIQMIKDCQAGKIDLIAFTRLDRWFRSVADYYEVQTQLDACGVPWRAIWEDYETETSAGVFKVNIMLSVAQSEADRTSERIKAINVYKYERGDYLGKAPLGYKLNKGELKKDEALREGFEAFFENYFKTLSIAEAMKAGAEKGLLLNRSHVYKLMKNTVYCGDASGGYKCEPYITKEQYALIRQRIGANPRKTASTERVYLFSGLVRCGYCQGRLASHTTARTHVDGQKVTYTKYDCWKNMTTKIEHKHLQITEAPLEAYLLDQLEALYKLHIHEIKALNEAIGNNDALKRKSALEARLKRLAVLYEDGDISTDSYKQKRDAIKDEISKIQLEPIPEPEPLPVGWQEMYNDLDAKHRQMFWRQIIKSITVTNENKEHPQIDFL